MTRSVTASAIAAVLADALAILLSFWLMPWLAGRLGAVGMTNACLMLVLYLAFCLAVYLLRRTGAVSARTSPGTWATILSLCCGLLATYMVLSASGFSPASVAALDFSSLSDSIIAIAGLAGSLIVVSLYMFVLIVPVRPEPDDETGPSLGARLLALLVTNLMLIGTFAFWQARLGSVGTSLTLSGLEQGMAFAGVYAVVALLFSGPRLLLARGGAGPVPLVTFLLQTAFYVWGLFSAVL